LTELSSLEPLFRRWERRVSLSSDDKSALAALTANRRTYQRDAYLVREGEPTTICTLLIQGFAFRQKLVTDGSRQIISFHIPGEFLDIQNSLLGVADHNVPDFDIYNPKSWRKDALLQLIAARPMVRQAIWFDTLLDASVFREWVVNVGRRDARQRIAHLLCELAARLKAAGLGDGPSYDFPLTQEQLADATGLTPVHTNRTLQTLRRDGLISMTSSKLTIEDWDGLADVGDFSERYLHHAA